MQVKEELENISGILVSLSKGLECRVRMPLCICAELWLNHTRKFVCSLDLHN